MATLKKKPRAAATGGVSENIVLVGSIASEDTALILARQARQLVARFGIGPHHALLVAELAFLAAAGGAR